MKPIVYLALLLVLKLNSGAIASAAEFPFDLRNGSSDESIFRMFNRQIGWGRGAKGVLRTIDGGQSWQTVLLTAPRQPVGCFFYDANTAWAAVGVMDDATNATIFRTTDAGKTWQYAEISEVSPILECLWSFPSKTSGWLMVVPDHGMNSEPGTLFHSVDSGQTWQKVNSGQWFDEKDSLKSENEWSQPHLPFCGSILFRNNSAGWLVGSYTTTTRSYLFSSSDGGKNWKGQSLPFPASFGESGRMTPSGLPRFFPSDGKKGVIRGTFVPQNPDSTNVPTVIYHTRDAGKTWQPGEPIFGGDCASSFYSATEGWLWRNESPGNSRLAQGTLFRTRDGGVSWTEIKAQKSLADVVKPDLRVGQLEFVDDQCGWAVARGNSLPAQFFRTGDGGKTWSELCVPADAKTASSGKEGPPNAREGYVLVRLESVGIIQRGSVMGGHNVLATFQPIAFKYPDIGSFGGGGGGYSGHPFEAKPVETKIGKSFYVEMLNGNSSVPHPQQSIANLLESCADEKDFKRLKLDLILSIPSAESAADWEGAHDYSHWSVESLNISAQ